MIEVLPLLMLTCDLKNIKPRIIPYVLYVLGKYLFAYRHIRIIVQWKHPLKISLDDSTQKESPQRHSSHSRHTINKRPTERFFKVGKFSARKMKKTYSTSSGVHIAIKMVELKTFSSNCTRSKLEWAMYCMGGRVRVSHKLCAV